MPRKQKLNQIQVAFLMDRQEHEIVSGKAKGLGMSLAAYFRFTGLKAEIKCYVKEER